MRKPLFILLILLCSMTTATAQVTIGIGAPGVSIGINFPVYPQLVPVPGYPVYYAPQANSNYFFYDGMYWVYAGDNWYASSWYNGPWQIVTPEYVPLFVLRVPVRYYRQPPAYFHGWRSDAPPRWGDHWGNSWQQQHTGWDNWNRSSVPAPAPLPVYQRQYSGNRYPQVQQQQALQSQNYRYQPKDAVVQRHYQAQQAQARPRRLHRPRRQRPRQRARPRLTSAATAGRLRCSRRLRERRADHRRRKSGGDVQRPVTTNAPQQQTGATPPPQRPQKEQAKVPAQDAALSVSPGNLRKRRPRVRRRPPRRRARTSHRKATRLRRNKKQSASPANLSK